MSYRARSKPRAIKSKKSKAKSKVNRRAKGPMIESLEGRQMLASPGTAFVEATGRLAVWGTAGNDTIVISKDPSNAANIRATVNGRAFSFRASYVKTVYVDASTGSDLVRSDESYGALVPPMLFLGGSGNDTLIAPTGGDCLIGSYDSDVIIATKGNNYVDAGPGNDRVFSGLGNDTVFGGAGNDYMLDSGGVNKTSDTSGANQVVKAAIPATIAGVAGWGAPASGSPAPTAPTAPVVTTPKPTPTPTPTPTPVQVGNNSFVIGVWSQPTYAFDLWKSRGINTVVGYEGLSGTVPIETFSKAALDRGLMMIRHPNWRNLASEKQWSNLIAWMHLDEPDLHNTPASVLTTDYAKLKAADPKMPVFVNFMGSQALWGYGTKTHADYQAYMKGADWISNDLYPISQHNRPSALDAPGQAVELLARLSGGKRQFAVIEAADAEVELHRGDYPGVTPDQFRAEVFNAVIGGATGIIYFPQRIGKGFKFDHMTPAVEAEMKKVNARLSRIGAALMSAKDPAGVSVAETGPLKTTWRKYGGKTYLIVLNNSNQQVAASMLVAGVAGTAAVDGEGRTVRIAGGKMADTFRPYEAHVYVV